MTVTSTTTRVVVVSNGITNGYATPIEVDDPNTIRVETTFDGVTTTPVNGADYDVQISNGYATIVFGVPPVNGTIITIWRETYPNQLVNLLSNARLPADVLETALDKLTHISQELADDLSRTVKLPRTATLEDPVIEAPVAGKLLRANDTGSGWTHVDPAVIDPNLVSLPLSIAQGGTGQTSAAAAREALGIGPIPINWQAPQDFPSTTGIKDITAPAVLRVTSDDTASTEIAKLELRSRSNSTALISYATVAADAVSRASGAETGRLKLVTRQNGSAQVEAQFGNGLLVGNAVGGAPGYGKINCSELLIDGSPLAGLVRMRVIPSITFTNGSGFFAVTVNHNFGEYPSFVHAFLRCTVANNGYNVGDQATFFPSGAEYSIWANENQCGLNIGSNFQVRHKTSGSEFTADPAEWKLEFHVFLVAAESF